MENVIKMCLCNEDFIKFQKKTEDHGVEAARSWMSTELENTDTEDYFTADVG